jgi:pilus assembly protein CpaC
MNLVILLALGMTAGVLRAATLPPIYISAGKTHIVDTAVNIERVSVAEPTIAEAVPVTPRTLMVNGKQGGETTLVVWLSDGTRSEYDVTVRVGEAHINAVRTQLERDFGGSITLTADSGSVYLNGTVKDMYASQRAVAIAETLGKVVNLLNVETPPRETQILLKVRFANVDRSKAQELGAGFFGAPHDFPFSVRPGQGSGGRITSLDPPTVSISDALNLLFWNPQLNVGATLKALASNNVLQILAEPNLLAMNGHEASFVAGGEFPFPTLQGGGSGVGQVTIQFRQFGVQIRFLPTITPRGTIRLRVAPEVSSLDYANALTVSGNTVPALVTRRVNTEVELEDGQTFAIAGLLDQRTTESLSKIPGLGDIPLLGKLFQSRLKNTSNSELLVIVTPELVAPVDAKDAPDLERPMKFMEGKGILNTAPQTPGKAVTGPVSMRPTRSEIPVQELVQLQTDLKQGLSASAGAATGSQASQPASGGTTTEPPAGNAQVQK